MTENELLAELLKELTSPDIEGDEVTADMLSKLVKCSWSTADRVLRAKEQAGLLVSRKVKLPNQHIATAYRKC